MNTSDRLIASASDIWRQCEEHPFVQGIANCDLAIDRFQFFLLQDYLYLFDYARVFALGVVKSDSLASMRVFGGYIKQILDGEMDIHKAYMKRLGISEEEAETVQPALDNLSYTSYMLAESEAGGEPEIASSILACAVSYEYIARDIVKHNPEAWDDPFFGEWVQGYACDEYHAANVELCDLMDRQVLDEQRYAKVEEIFVNCSLYELAFWQMAWDKRMGPALPQD